MALLSAVVVLTGCEKKKDPEFKIQIVGNHDLIPGQHWQLNVLKMYYMDEYCDGNSWSSTYETLNNTKIQWEVEHPEILSIDSCGMITAHNYGETRVTAYYAPCNCSYTTTIKVGEYLDFSPCLVFNGREFWAKDNDAVFNRLIETGADKDKDGKISAEEIHQVEELDCTDMSPFIRFPFLDVCTNLKKIYICSYEQEFDFSYNPLLEDIYVEAEKVIVSPKNSNLKSLTIASSVAHLDLSACDKLQSLEILRSEIEYLDLSGCSSLEFLEYEDIEDRPFCFDCSACPNLHYVNIQYYNKRSTTIKMDPFFYTHYQKEPYRKRNNETTPDDFYDNIQKYYPWYEHCNAHPGGARIPDMILTYEWYFDAQLIQ